jgi:hypothetical protein
MPTSSRPGGLPPAGWYPDPQGGQAPRWWSGTEWGPAGAETVNPGRPATLRWPLIIFTIGVFFVALFTAAGGGFGAFLTTLGLTAVVVGIVALARNGIRWLSLRNRTAGGLAIAAGLVVVLLGGSASAAVDDRVPAADSRGLVDVEETSTSAPTQEPDVIETEELTTTEAVPFERITVEDASILQGTTTVTTAGVDGVRTITWMVRYTDGVETDRRQVAAVVTTPPVSEVTSVGTMVPRAAAPAPPASSSGCDPNYTGCVPVASDVDCAGGSGNGPAYATGPVTVIGSDIYDLDSDGDGVACE